MIRTTVARLLLLVARRKQRLNTLEFLGRPSFVSRSAEFSFQKKIKIGRYCRIGPHCHLDGEGGVIIGDGSILAPAVALLSGSHNYRQTEFLPYDNTDKLAPVKIGRGVWIGYGAIVTPGVSIGDGAVIAAGAVVTKEIQAGEVVGGNPAKVLAQREMNTNHIAKLVDAERYYLKVLWNGDIARTERKTKKLEVVGVRR